MEDNEVMERIHKLADAIRTTRKIKNITQKELSEKAGVSTSIISQMENHKIVPRLETVIEQCRKTLILRYGDIRHFCLH